MSDVLTLKASGQQLSGWTEISVTRRLEGLPNNFEVSATQDSPTLKDAKGLKEGDPCTVYLGSDPVLTGYVDDVLPAFAAGEHGVTVAGRGKCADLVDCSAKWKGCQVTGSNALEIAQKLAQPFGITATCNGDPGPTVPQFNISVGDTPQAILELICRHAALLYYEGVDGNLILSELARDRAASGFTEGVNVQAARLKRSMAGRYSEYICAYLSIDTSGLFQDNDGLFFGKAADPNVSRFRRLVIVAEAVQGGLVLAQNRADWEASRRAGRGRAVTLLADSWRDASGKLWAPNTLAPVNLPHLALTQAVWCISEVTYRQSADGGRTADVTLMPQESFLPEPIILQPVVGGLT